MRRLLAAPLALLVLVTAAGCSRPAGVDGNLVNGWPMLPKVGIPAQQIGSCYQTAYQEVWNDDLVTINCDGGNWQTQTAYVGTFDVTDTAAPTPPLENGPSRIAAYTACGTAADAFIGGDWHTARVELGLVVPGPADWSAGQRWYRCDLMWTTGAGGSFRDGFTTMPLNLRVSCLTVTADGNTSDDDCATPHNGEFAGLYTPPVILVTAPDLQTVITDGCRTVVATYLGLTTAQARNPYVGWGADDLDKPRWLLGDRITRCYAIADLTFTKPLKGIGTTKPAS